MGLGYCKTGNSKSEDDTLIVPDFQEETNAERKNLINNQRNALHSMFIQAQKKKALERGQYFSLKSVAAAINCDISSLRKWIKRHGIKTTTRRTVDSNYQACTVLTKEQVQVIMEKK